MDEGSRADTRPRASVRPLISLPQIAALARVQRPVVSMWRTRFASGRDAFPAPVSAHSHQELFDASQVAEWLAETSHGKNPDAVADAAAFASADDAGLTGGAYRSVVESLLALRVLDGMPLTQGDLQERAASADPGDAALRREIESLSRGSTLPEHVEKMIEAAYSPAGAATALRGQTAASASSGASGTIGEQGTRLIARLTQAVADSEDVVLADSPGLLDAGTLVDAASMLCGDELLLHIPLANREVRRRLIIDDRSPMLSDHSPAPGAPAVWLARLHGADTAAELAQLEELVVELSDHQRLVAVGPDALLTEPLTGAAAASREFLLRSGRVRGIVRLPSGLVPTAVRQSLAVWLIGGPQGGASLGERFTVIGDLRGVSLTDARTHDLIADLAVSLGSAQDALAHAFRFVHFVRTSTLIAAEGSLVAASRPRRSARESVSELAALVDRKLDQLTDPPALPTLRAASASPAREVTLGDAIASREVRLIAGTRLAPSDTTAAEGYPVIGRGEVVAQGASERRIDRIQLAARYPRAQLTLPGDVVILSGAHAAALVDHEGSSVVEYPARVLRLQDDTLAPEVVAADINGLAGPVPIKRWSLRRMASDQRPVLGEALAAIVSARRDAERRASDLAELEALVTDAIATGALTADLEPPHLEGSL